jgi:hypothetical protein
MHTLVVFSAYLLGAPATAAAPGSQHALAVLGASGVLLFAFVAMKRALVPFAEIHQVGPLRGLHFPAGRAGGGSAADLADQVSLDQFGTDGHSETGHAAVAPIDSRVLCGEDRGRGGAQRGRNGGP